MALIRNLAVCESTDILMFADSEGLAGWNELHDLIWSHDRDVSRAHRHWWLNSFVLTSNFFNPKYLDDAYGLRWNALVRDVCEKFMKANRLKKVLVVTCKNHSLLVL